MNPELTTHKDGNPPRNDEPTDADAQRPLGGLKQRAKRGTALFIVSQVIGNIMRLGSNLLLTRLLFPEHFGLMALVNIFVSGINMFSDIGIRPSIVQNKRGDDQTFLNTAWTMQVIRGVIIWLVACLVAYPLAVGVYDLPILAKILPVAAFSSVVLGFQSTKIYTAGRHLLLGREMLLQIGTGLLGMAVMALLAWVYQSVWALVFGGLFSAALSSTLTHFVFPGPNNRFAWDRECLGELIRFGRWVFMGTVLVFIANNMDRLLLGKLVDIDTLGVYNIAFILSSMPTMLFKRFGNKVVFPVVSRQANLDRDVLREKLLNNTRKLVMLMAIPVVILIIAGDVIVELAWTEEYHQAGWMASVLAIGMWAGVLQSTSSPILFALGKPQYAMFGNLGRIIWVGLAAWLCFTWLPSEYQLFGFLLAFGFSELPSYFVMAYGGIRERINLWKQDIWLTAILICVVAALVAGRYALGWGIPFLPPSV